MGKVIWIARDYGASEHFQQIRKMVVALDYKKPVMTEMRSKDTSPVDFVTKVCFEAFGLNVISSEATIVRSGRPECFSGGPFTLRPAAPGHHRYDLCCLDLRSQTRIVFAGKDRKRDASYFTPEPVSLDQIPIALFRVRDDGFDILELTNIVDGECMELAPWLRKERSAARFLIAPFREKIVKHEPITILALGDSIMAFQDAPDDLSRAALKIAPNGRYRDKAASGRSGGRYLLDAYEADAVAGVPLFTAEELGRPDDGDGRVHTKIGYMWTLLDVLERDYSYKLGFDLHYKNFGVALASSADLIIDEQPTAFLLAAEAEFADLVVYGFGQNEIDDPDTQRRTSLALRRLRESGKNVIAMGISRPTWLTKEQYEFTDLAIRGAASSAGVAFQSVSHLYDEQYIRAMGLFPVDRSAANRINHPGLTELTAIGTNLTKTVVADLWQEINNHHQYSISTLREEKRRLLAEIDAADREIREQKRVSAALRLRLDNARERLKAAALDNRGLLNKLDKRRIRLPFWR